MVRAMCGVQLKDRKRSTEEMLMLRLNESINHLATVNSVCWYCYVLKREDGHVLRTLDFLSRRSKEEREAEQNIEKAGRGRNCEG